MNILFVHQNFPGQFKFLAPALARQGHTVVAITMQRDDRQEWQGVRLVRYAVSRGTTPGVHPWLSDFETKTIRAEACFRAALKVRQAGFNPDVIIAHPGWGESLFLKEVWPRARLGIYCEFHYGTQADTGFDPEFPTADPEGEVCRLHLKNLNNLLHADIADAALSPTRWQASTFPEPFRSRITVVHDGIDTDALRPEATARLSLSSNGQTVTLTPGGEVVTFVNRNLEPYRGYHIFMRALPEILAQRPAARVLIVGGDGASYGPRPEGGRSWREIFAAEVRPRIPDTDWARVHFLGNLGYPAFQALLRISTVHVYLTYPFVLSWSLLEAMSTGCAIVASATPPVSEVIQHSHTGRLVGFFDTSRLAGEVCELLADPAARVHLGANARAHIRAHYDLRRVCLPAQLQWVGALAG